VLVSLEKMRQRGDFKVSKKESEKVAEEKVAKETNADQTAVPNAITEETGQLDARFLLWRTFCDENQVPVETLPSDLTGEVKEKWEKLKDDELHKPAEEGKKS
jgi:hypothetical protein